MAKETSIKEWYMIGKTSSNNYATFTEITCLNCSHNTSICLWNNWQEYNCPSCENSSEFLEK